jgi:hypothetical protein
MPVLISNKGSILDRVICYCTQTFYVNTDHRFLSILMSAFHLSFCTIICVVKL